LAGSLISDLITQVYMGLRDTDQTFFTPTQVGNYLNEGYLDIASRLRLLRSEVTGTVGTDGTIPFPADYVEFLSLTIGSLFLAEVSNQVFDSYSTTGDTPAATIYRFFGTNIETYPTTDTASASYTLRYAALPPKLDVASTTATFTYLPGELDRRIVAYARAQCRYLDGDTGEADRLMSTYERGLPDEPRAMARWGRGPDSLVPEPGYFDE